METPPLPSEQAARLANASWVDVGGGFRVLAMAAPVDRSFPALRELGIRRAVFLLDRWGLRTMYGSPEALGIDYRQVGIEPIWLETANLGAPRDTAPMVDACRRVLEDGSATAAVHCRHGVGRTGLVLCCLMVARGASVEEAVASLRVQRAPLQSGHQRRYLERFREAWARGDEGNGDARP